MNGGKRLCPQAGIQMIGLILVNTFSTTSILSVTALLIQKAQIYSTFTGIMSAFVGFITGAFLPIGMLPADIQKLFAFFPAHHGATMMREIMTTEALSATFGSVADQTIKGRLMTAQEIKQTYAAENGIIYIFENTRFTFPVMLTIVIGAGMVFFLISCMFMMKYRKK